MEDLFELKPAEYEKTRHLFEALDQHLALSAILARSTPARVLVDNPDRPRAALAWSGHRFHLAGSPDNEDWNAAVGRLFSETVYPQELAAGAVMFTLYYAPEHWEDRIDVILPDKYPIKTERQYYEFNADTQTQEWPDWRALLPQGFSLHTVDQSLLEQTHLRNLDDLKSEMCSERPSVQDFLERSFGVCLVHGDELTGWCLSEYNHGQRCEVGIETQAQYQRRGLGTLMTRALLELAQSRGVTQVGWHCWASNITSAATALKSGFTKVCDYPAYFAWYDMVDNLVVNGNMHFGKAHYRQAMTWYERAFARGEAKGWGYWNAACAAAELGLREDALRHLAHAVSKGFGDAERLRNSEHLRSLRATDEWSALLRQLEHGAT